VPYCADCGAKIEPTDSFCRECGTEVDPIDNEFSEPTQTTIESKQNTSSQSGTTTHSDDELVKQYSSIAWFFIIFGNLSMISRAINRPSIISPLVILVGLAVLGYFAYKTTQDKPVNQTKVEVWTTIILGIFGIAAVEVAGDRGARILWKIFISVVILWIITLLV
jgi:membrane-associated HD superfamily phosphohydrolase